MRLMPCSLVFAICRMSCGRLVLPVWTDLDRLSLARKLLIGPENPPTTGTSKFDDFELSHLDVIPETHALWVPALAFQKKCSQMA